MAAYNGEKFIAAQLESLLNQTYKHWQLYIRDDGSKDNTLNIIKAYRQKDVRIHLVSDNLGNLGSCQNFSALMMNQLNDNDEYIMFCDQDDVWLPGKIEDTLTEMLRLQKQYGTEMPLLLHTNFLYVDIAMQPIEAKKNYTATKIQQPVFANVLCQNSVHGCTMMVNKQLAGMVGTIPAEAENHDYWFALVASAFGKIVFLNKRTVLYRQHGSNASTQHNFNSFAKRFRRIIIDKKNFNDVKEKLRMALVFKRTYYKWLSKSNRRIINEFIALFKVRNLPLLIKNIKNGVRRQTFNQTLLFYISTFFAKRSKVIQRQRA